MLSIIIPTNRYNVYSHIARRFQKHVLPCGEQKLLSDKSDKTHGTGSADTKLICIYTLATLVGLALLFAVIVKTHLTFVILRSTQDRRRESK